VKWIDVAKVDEFESGTARSITVEDTKIAVFNVNGEFYAIEDACTHDFETLSGGEVDGYDVICPWHGARFDLKTGEALAAPAYDPVATFSTRMEDGIVQVAWTEDD